MKDKSIDIKALRKELALNQAQLAGILAVTQATVARWESRSGTIPTGDAARRLNQLQAMMAIPKEKKVIQKMVRVAGGLDAVAALLSLGSSIGGTAIALVGAGTLFGPAGIAGSLAAGLLYRLLKKTQNEDRERKRNEK